jgi:uroporphyrinogen-III synthase
MTIRRVVITASLGSILGLPEALRAHNLEASERPLLRFGPPQDWTAFDQALANIERFRAIAVTSPRAALALVRRIPRKPCAVPAWTTGNISAMLLRAAMTSVHATEYTESEGAAEAVAGAILQARTGSPVFFPCGDLHRNALIFRLQAAGVKVESVICYRTILGSTEDAKAACAGADLVLVASPSVARLLSDGVPAGARPLLMAAGPTTARAAENAGWPADIVARKPSAAAILEALSQLQPS